MLLNLFPDISLIHLVYFSLVIYVYRERWKNPVVRRILWDTTQAVFPAAVTLLDTLTDHTAPSATIAHGAAITSTLFMSRKFRSAA
jgi:hypothetical protein